MTDTPLSPADVEAQNFANVVGKSFSTLIDDMVKSYRDYPESQHLHLSILLYGTILGCIEAAVGESSQDVQDAVKKVAEGVATHLQAVEDSDERGETAE